MTFFAWSFQSCGWKDFKLRRTRNLAVSRLRDGENNLYCLIIGGEQKVRMIGRLEPSIYRRNEFLDMKSKLRFNVWYALQHGECVRSGTWFDWSFPRSPNYWKENKKNLRRSSLNSRKLYKGTSSNNQIRDRGFEILHDQAVDKIGWMQIW